MRIGPSEHAVLVGLQRGLITAVQVSSLRGIHNKVSLRWAQRILYSLFRKGLLSRTRVGRTWEYTLLPNGISVLTRSHRRSAIPYNIVHRKLHAQSPGPWVDEIACVCGCKYAEFNSKVCWADAVRFMRTVNDECYFSRGPVLHVLRYLKLCAWYSAHYYCGMPEEYTERQHKAMTAAEWCGLT